MARHFSLDDLIDLNDEIIALSRAGVPLDRGLRELGGEVSGRFGAAARGLSERLEAGQSLDQALGAIGGGGLPEVYLAVVRAGLKTGRLPAALEGLAVAARRSRQLRRTIALALVYPTIVLLLAYVLLVLALQNWFPVLSPFYDSFGEEVPVLVQWLSRLGATASRWAAIPPLLAVLAGIAWWLWSRGWLRSGDWSSGSRRGRGRMSMLHNGRLAGFAEVLALLVEQQVPLPECLVLAADASGDRVLARDCHQLADQLARGETPQRTDSLPRSLPLLLGWLITNSRRPEELSDSLRRLSQSYHTRAQESADWYSMYLPIWLTVGIGGTAVATYAVTIFAPWCHVLIQLGKVPAG